ncbi:MAG: hypothetical protein JNM58_08165 [Xanthomonadaceae bacterium]|nr:hypothetical protein [Xanthomonadaceae bacterium]
MKTVRLVVSAVCSLALSAAFCISAASPVQIRSPAHGPAAPAERAALIRAFVMKWGGHVERVYGVDVHAWSQRMVPVFARGDADNLRDAVRRDTFESALSALNGRPVRVDERTIARSPIVARALGDLAQDLAFTPVQPCRIVDTRIAQGAVAAGQVRSYRAAGRTSYADQGGSATNCGLQNEVPGAVMLSVTAVSPAQAGYATVFTAGTTVPGTASLNYVAGAVVNNAAVVRVPNPATAYDFSIYSYATSDYVVDVIGFFAAPQATALSCVDSGLAQVTIGIGATGQVTAPACLPGYTATQLDCESGSWSMPIVFSSLRGGGICGARNGGNTAATLTAARRCCRVPGR